MSWNEAFNTKTSKKIWTLLMGNCFSEKNNEKLDTPVYSLNTPVYSFNRNILFT